MVCVKIFLLYWWNWQQKQNYSSRPTFVKLFVFVSADVLCYNMIPKSQILPILLNTKNDGSAFHLHTEALNDLWCFTHFITDDDLNFYTHTHNNPEAKCCPRHDVCVEWNYQWIPINLQFLIFKQQGTLCYMKCDDLP